MINTPVNNALALRFLPDDAYGYRFIKACFLLTLLSASGHDKQTYQNTKIAGLLKLNPNWQQTLHGERERSKAPFFLNSISGFFPTGDDF